jgi:hypothetical protein
VDLQENRALLRVLDGAPSFLPQARLFTQLKLMFILLFALGILLAVGLGVRRTWRHLTQPDAGAAAAPAGGTFRTSSRGSTRSSGGERRRGSGRAQGPHETAAEPGSTRPRDVGRLALSGGGIRSATFNLATEACTAPTCAGVDYLATVRGGGTGGF